MKKKEALQPHCLLHSGLVCVCVHMFYVVHACTETCAHSEKKGIYNRIEKGLLHTPPTSFFYLLGKAWD